MIIHFPTVENIWIQQQSCLAERIWTKCLANVKTCWAVLWMAAEIICATAISKSSKRRIALHLFYSLLLKFGILIIKNISEGKHSGNPTSEPSFFHKFLWEPFQNRSLSLYTFPPHELCKTITHQNYTISCKVFVLDKVCFVLDLDKKWISQECVQGFKVGVLCLLLYHVFLVCVSVSIQTHVPAKFPLHSNT